MGNNYKENGGLREAFLAALPPKSRLAIIEAEEKRRRERAAAAIVCFICMVSGWGLLIWFGGWQVALAVFLLLGAHRLEDKL